MQVDIAHGDVSRMCCAAGRRVFILAGHDKHRTGATWVRQGPAVLRKWHIAITVVGVISVLLAGTSFYYVYAPPPVMPQLSAAARRAIIRVGESDEISAACRVTRGPDSAWVRDIRAGYRQEGGGHRQYPEQSLG